MYIRGVNIGEGRQLKKTSLLMLTQKSALKMVNICKFENFFRAAHNILFISWCLLFISPIRERKGGHRGLLGLLGRPAGPDRRLGP